MKGGDMTRSWSTLGFILGAIVLAILAGSSPATAVEVGEPAPDFKLASTRGIDIALADFRGKKWVFLEFYGGDFHPS
jgi:AhpC/TSA family protein